MIKNTSIFFLVFSIVILSACGNYQKVVKGNNYEEKFTLANTLYEKGDFSKAIGLYEQVYQRFPKTDQGEVAYFRLAQSYYGMEAFYMAGYYYYQFNVRYPTSEKADEALFLDAICSVKLSPKVTLDQTDTRKALTSLQTFIERYPNSSLIDSCNNVMDRLRHKLQTKEFNSVELYDKLEDYRAAVASAESFLEEYPQSSYTNEAAIILCNNAHTLAMESVLSKKRERINKALELFGKYENLFDSKKHTRKSIKQKEELKEELLLINEQYAYNDIVQAFKSSNTSSEHKKINNLKETIARFNTFAQKYPESSYMNKANKIHEKAEKELDKYLN